MVQVCSVFPLCTKYMYLHVKIRVNLLCSMNDMAMYCVLSSLYMYMYVFCVAMCVQALCLAVGRGILYSAGTDLSLRSWHIDSLEEIGIVKVHVQVLVHG